MADFEKIVTDRVYAVEPGESLRIEQARDTWNGAHLDQQVFIEKVTEDGERGEGAFRRLFYAEISEMTAPASPGVLAGAAVTFHWSAGKGVTQNSLDVGTTHGGSEISTVSFAAGILEGEIAGIPTDGNPVHVRLWSKVNAAWLYNDYEYTAAGP